MAGQGGARGGGGALGLRGVEGPPAVTPAEMRAKWDGLWAAGLAPGDRFDARAASPALLARLGRLGGLEGARVLVPGCGRGYDLAAFVQAGAAEAVGLEISPSACDAAREYLAGALGDSGLAGRASVELRNFFEEDSFAPENLGQFDLVYDYTFFCAINPSLRDDWASGMARAVRPGGRLATLMFPVDPSRGRDVGPPYAVETADYEGRLGLEGFRTEFVEEVPNDESHFGRGGMEKFGVFIRGDGSSEEGSELLGGATRVPGIGASS